MAGSDQAGVPGLPPRQATGLPAGECWRLLASVPLGRVVFTMDALPAIRPVSHLVDGKVIIIRSDLGAAITARAAGPKGAVVCFEADALDPAQHTGWSVVATGTARLVVAPRAVARYERLLEPWVSGQEEQVVAIRPQLITGTRLHAPGRAHPLGRR